MKRFVVLLVLVAAVVAFVCPVSAQTTTGNTAQSIYIGSIAKDVTSDWTAGPAPAKPAVMTPGAQIQYNKALTAYNLSKGVQLQNYLKSSGLSARGYTLIAAFQDPKTGYVTLGLINKDKSIMQYKVTPVAGTSKYNFTYGGTLSSRSNGVIPTAPITNPTDDKMRALVGR